MGLRVSRSGSSLRVPCPIPVLKMSTYPSDVSPPVLGEMDFRDVADDAARPVLADLGFVLKSLSFPVRYASPLLANKRAQSPASILPHAVSVLCALVAALGVCLASPVVLSALAPSGLLRSTPRLARLAGLCAVFLCVRALIVRVALCDFLLSGVLHVARDGHHLRREDRGGRGRLSARKRFRLSKGSHGGARVPHEVRCTCTCTVYIPILACFTPNWDRIRHSSPLAHSRASLCGPHGPNITYPT